MLHLDYKGNIVAGAKKKEGGGRFTHCIAFLVPCIFTIATLRCPDGLVVKWRIPCDTTYRVWFDWLPSFDVALFPHLFTDMSCFFSKSTVKQAIFSFQDVTHTVAMVEGECFSAERCAVCILTKLLKQKSISISSSSEDVFFRRVS